MSVLTVTLNAAVDRVYSVPGFSLNCVNRPVDASVFAGGKGINVARVITRLCGIAHSTGFLGGTNGEFIRSSMQSEGLSCNFEKIAGETRLCIAAVDPYTGNQTEINEQGPDITASEVERLRLTLTGLLDSKNYEYLILSGSIPHGVPIDFYAECIELARQRKIRTVLDASGEPFRAGIAAKPWMIKPNVHEFNIYVGRSLGNEYEVVEAAKDLVGTGISVVCVTRGGNTAVMAMEDCCTIARPPVVKVVSAVGSGDSFVGAFVWSLMNGQNSNGAFVNGLAAGAANAERYGSGFIDLSDVKRLMPFVETV